MSTKAVDLFIKAAIIAAILAPVAAFADLCAPAFAIASVLFLIGSAIIDRLDRILVALKGEKP